MSEHTEEAREDEEAVRLSVSLCPFLYSIGHKLRLIIRMPLLIAWSPIVPRLLDQNRSMGKLDCQFLLMRAATYVLFATC